MSVQQQDWKPEQGEKDAARHREIIKEEVKKGILDTVINTPIINKKGKLKVRIRGKKDYHFRHKDPEEFRDVGQGKGKKGDVIDAQIKKGKGPGDSGIGHPDDFDDAEGGAGGEPGEDWIETEMDIEEIFDIVTEEIGLPKLKKKKEGQIEVQKGWKPSGTKKTGIPPRLKKKLTVQQAIKRWSGIILGLKQMLEEKLGKKPDLDDQHYVWALNSAKLDKDKAIEILLKIINGERKVNKKDLENATIILDEDDLRYTKLEQDIEYESNAVISAIMDVSGSMGTEKKLIARSFYWWSYEMLKRVYQNVEIVFIIHHAEAQVVSEERFFHTVQSGGTLCAPAYMLTADLIHTTYPPEAWNIYTFHFSDGEDFDRKAGVKSLKNLLPLVNAFGYGETLPYGSHSLLDDYIDAFDLDIEEVEGLEVYFRDDKDTYFIATALHDREAIWPTIKVFFRKDEEVE
ncbi:DUF444 family protein [Patescibacteria group bacterium AH-259-L05]|nr:DUF444 family protein [Patescibacteria group bacterium AH-259-L05]